MKYALLYLNSRRIGYNIPSLQPDQPIRWTVRAAPFRGSTSQAVVAYYSLPGCLKVFDPKTDLLYPLLPKQVTEAMALSNISRIITNANPPIQLPVAQFGKETQPTWCYYFEKAELAIQNQQWSEIITYYKEALQQGLTAENPLEYIPFINAYAHLGEYEKAYQMTIKVRRGVPLSTPMLCNLWTTIKQEVPHSDEGKTWVRNILDDLDCENP
jgi:hypothetical protein